MTIKELQTHLQAQIDRLKTRSRNWLIAAGVALVLAIILLFTVFKKQKEDETLTVLKQQQEQLDRISQEQKKTAEQDRLRDSVYWATYMSNSKQREGQLSTSKKKADEIINRINQPDFSADSIKSWWANN
jgi:type II secretory pathway component PulM